MDGDAHSRPADHARITLINKEAKRHLRHVCEQSSSRAASLALEGSRAKGGRASNSDQRMFGCDYLPRDSHVQSSAFRFTENERYYLSKDTSTIQRSYGILAPSSNIPSAVQGERGVMGLEGDEGGVDLGSRVWEGLPSPPWRTPSSETRVLPNGGHVRVLLEAQGLGADPTGPNPPNLLVTVR